MNRFLQNGLILFFLFACLNASAQGFLHTRNQLIVDGNEQTVLLRGMGLGGWMLQEPYMMNLVNVANQSDFKAKLTAFVGAAGTDSFYTAWLNNYLRKGDVDSLKAWGFNSVRLPLHYNLFTLPTGQEPVAGEDTWLPRGFELVDSLLSWCSQNRMYVILDLHAAPGGQGVDRAISDYDNARPSLWESGANKAKTINLWKKLAARYAREPYIGGYDLINETNWGFEHPNTPGCDETAAGNAPLRDLFVAIRDAVRTVDTNHIIFIEGNCWSNNHNGLWPFPDRNVVASFHKYWTYNNPASIDAILAIGQENGVPVWMGEAGENSNIWNRDAIRLLEANNIGWAWWTYKKMGVNCPLTIPSNNNYNVLAHYLATGALQPAAADAVNGLMALAESVKLENNLYRPDFVDALFRQVQTNATLPFIPGQKATDTLFCVNYDLGLNRFAYYDLGDTADYRSSTGISTAWNNGYVYRSDGVDIEPIDVAHAPVNNGYNVNSTETHEWLQYTVQVPVGGSYNFVISTAGASDTGRLTVTADGGVALINQLVLPNTGDRQTWRTTGGNVNLTAGSHAIRLVMAAGGANLNYFTFTPNFALPVKLLYFRGEKSAAGHVLQWSAALQADNLPFALQRSTDGHTFSTIGLVDTKEAGGSSLALKYSFTDHQPASGTNYYRLLLQDKTGAMTYSDVVRLDQTGNTSLTAFVSPNPVRDNAGVSLFTTTSRTVQISLYGSEGRLVWSGRVFIRPGQQKISIPMHGLSRGIYHAVLRCTGEKEVHIAISKE